MHTVCGLLMHSNLAVTTEGLPLGLSAIKFWTRQKFKGTAALKRKVNPTRVPIECKESVRWLESDWKLITDLPVRSRAQAIEKLRWYAMRWKTELFHKILKSGCRAEDAKLRTAKRLVNLLSLYCILSWRISWLTMLNRVIPDGSPRLALTALEIDLLDELVQDKGLRSRRRKTLSHYLTKVARIGGYVARGYDPPPGNTVIWRGLTRLMDIELGATIGARIYG
jgi:hypothetical protein